MFAEERREQILLYLKKHKRAEVKELIEEFQVTGATLRADLRAMEEEGSIVRTHGGALLKEDVLQKEDFLSLRRGHEEEKKAIARIARAYVKEGDAVILDSGSTTLELALLLKDAKNIKVITNDLQIALELQENPWIELYIVGGKVRNNFRLTQGAIGTDFLKSIAVNKVFLSPNALSVFEGATTSNEEMKELKRAMMKAAGEIYMLCDSSKIGQRAFCKFARLSEFKLMLTDSGISKLDTTEIEAQGLEVNICK